MQKLPRATDDIALSARVWNRAATEIERSANIQVSPPLELTDGPSGRRLAIRNLPDRLYWGVVQCNGPQGTEPDYTVNRYWVALGFVSNDQTDDPTAMVEVTAYPSGDPRRSGANVPLTFGSCRGSGILSRRDSITSDFWRQICRNVFHC